ncbi:MAG: T9SS type A sorting domain-containing protein [Bacteroidales bacterium]
MKMVFKRIFPARSAIIFVLFLIINHTGSGQSLTISQGTILVTTGGTLVLEGDLKNNGSCLNNNNTVIFSGITQAISGNTPASFNNLTVDAGSTTTITTPGQSLGGILLSDGTFNANGNLTLLSTEIQTAMIDGSGTGEVNGNITMQRYLASGFGYKYFSPPFQGSEVSEFSDNMKLNDPFPAFFRYDESRTTSGWVTYIDPAGILNPMEGYAIDFGSSNSPITFDVTGVVNNGPMSATLYNHNNTYSQGFSLVGNPYPSPVDWDALSGWTRVNIDNALYYFEASTTDEFGGMYVTYIDGVSSNGLATNLIPSMQGYFVHVTDGTFPVTGSIAVNNDARIIDLTQPLTKSDGDPRPLIRLAAGYKADTLSFDQVVIYFDEKATGNFDGQLDALKLMNTDFMVANFYTVGPDGKKLSISALPVITDTLLRIPLGLSTNLAGKVLFRISTLEGNLENMEIFLSDELAKSKQDLSDGNTYEVDLPAGQHENRFFLEFKNLDTGISDNTTGEDLFRIYSSHGILKLEIDKLTGPEGILMITNLTGQTSLIKKYYNPGSYEISSGLESGIYIVTFTSGTKRISKKIFIGNQ